jgi:lipopolysaccharide/colanic/teichoic acid biosynthesis glycosyltransferase
MYRSVKCGIDLLLAVVLFVLLVPLFLLLAILIRLDSAGPAIYRQKRVGLFGTPFVFYKFRTMKIGTPVLSTAEMERQEVKPYTRIGPFLRKTSLDELPQLFNIIKREMSFVGPRPALLTQTDVNALREAHGVDAVRPGITGLAQVRGRDDLDVQSKVNYDLDYCRKMSLFFDARIVLETIGAVLTARGNK